MPRTARQKSKTGIYHIVIRGINRQTVFFDDEDRKVFLSRLKTLKGNCRFEIYSFCLMDNHIHLLIKENEIPISKIMQRMLTSYIIWYNRKYERVGNLFQDRYKSENIENDLYFLSCIRYIHQNPVKADLVDNIADYNWSSYSAYVNDKDSFIDTQLVLGMFNGKDEFLTFLQGKEENSFLELEAIIRISDEKLIKEIKRIIKKDNISEIMNSERNERNKIITRIKEIPGTSIRQISRVTGISTEIIRYL